MAEWLECHIRNRIWSHIQVDSTSSQSKLHKASKQELGHSVSLHRIRTIRRDKLTKQENANVICHANEISDNWRISSQLILFSSCYITASG